MDDRCLNKLIDHILNKGFAITIYNNALGTITGKLHSVSEIVIEDDDLADGWKNKPNQRKVTLEGETMVNGKSLSDVISHLYKKSEI